MIIALTLAAGITGLLAIQADWNEARPKRFYLLKPLTTVLILSVAASAPPHAAVYQHWIVAALLLSLAGDVCLMFRSDRWFLAGLSSFLLAHGAFVAAFLSGILQPKPPLWSYAALLCGIISVFVLWPRAGRLRIPVVVYTLVLAAMVLAAAARHASQGNQASLWALCGALFFMASDSLLAYRQFMRPYRGAQPLILSTYWIAIGLIAWSI